MPRIDTVRAQLVAISASSVPICVSAALSAAIGLVDVHLAGSLGETAQAGVGIADQMLFLSAIFATGIAQGAGSMIARATGAKDDKLAQAVAHACLLLAIMTGTFAAIVTYIFASAAVSVFTSDPRAQQAGAIYLSLCAPANLAYAIMIAQTAILRARGKFREVMLPWLVAAAVSISLSLILPNLITHGKVFTLELIALAWNLGAIAGVVSCEVVLKKENISLLNLTKIGIQGCGKLSKKFAQIVKIGLPIALTEAAWLGSNFAMYSILALLPAGNEAQAAWTIRLKLEELIATTPIIAFSLSAASVVGQLMGANKKQEARRMTWLLSWVSATFMAVVAIAIALLSGQIASFYAVSQQSKVIVSALIYSSCAIYPLLAFYLTAFGALEGAGFTIKPMLALSGGLFLLRVPLAYLLAIHCHMEITGIIIAVAISHLAVTLAAVSQVRQFFASEKTTICARHSFSQIVAKAGGFHVSGGQESHSKIASSGSTGP
ncbi:MAG: hypothetical protein IAF58_22620 [Leptolyngbya sp.]|nr:hypothetical protein [Candidatus Melainabacteria bacterium]